MKKYSGNGTMVEQIPEPLFVPVHIPEEEKTVEVAVPLVTGARHEYEQDCDRQSAGPPELCSDEKKPLLQSLFGNLGGLLGSAAKEPLEVEDYLILAILYLLYRESGDIEFLIIGGIMLLT